MEELLELLDRATNVKTAMYDKEKGTWLLTFYHGDPSEIETDILFDFLENA